MVLLAVSHRVASLLAVNACKGLMRNGSLAHVHVGACDSNGAEVQLCVGGGS